MATLSTIKKKGLVTYSADGLSNINLGLNGFDILSNGFGTNETRYPCSGNGLDGALVHEAIITDDGEVPTYNDGTEDYTATISNFGGINLFSTSFTFGVGFGTVGVLAPNTWIKVRDEIMWISAIVGATVTVTRGQMGTTPTGHGQGEVITTLGLAPSVITEAFKVPCGYWKAVKCISTNMPAQSVNVQLSGAFDDLTLRDASSGTTNYDPEESNKYIPMGAGDILYGQFNRVALDEPADPAPLTPPAENVAKLMLIRG